MNLAATWRNTHPAQRYQQRHGQTLPTRQLALADQQRAPLRRPLQPPELPNSARS